MSESDIDAMIERMAREEQEEIARAQGQLILDVLSADRQGRDAQLVEALNAAFLASHNRAEAGTDEE